MGFGQVTNGIGCLEQDWSHPGKGQRQENHDFLPTDLLVQHLIFNAGILGW